jgi:hypothetical protein
MNRQLRESVSDHSRSPQGNDLLREVLRERLVGKDGLRNIEEFGRHAGFDEEPPGNPLTAQSVLEQSQRGFKSGPTTPMPTALYVVAA